MVPIPILGLALVGAACVTVGAHGGFAATVNSERDVGLHVSLGLEPGFTGGDLDSRWGLLVGRLEVGLGVDLASRERVAAIRIDVLGLAHQRADGRWGDRGGGGVQFRFTPRGWTIGPSLSYARERVVASRFERGECPDEGAYAFHALGFSLAADVGLGDDERITTLELGGRYGYSRWPHVHPFTGCEP